jgi:nucleotide-binding universal stress UspA family protein
MDCAGYDVTASDQPNARPGVTTACTMQTESARRMNMITQAPNPSRVVILAAIDGSHVSDDVLRTSSMLGEALGGAELHLLHIVEPTPDPDGRNAILSSATELFDGARSLLDTMVERARPNFGGRIVGHLAVGTPWREILQLSTNLQADLIVVGSYRKKSVERILLGSVSEQVVRKASCAVLVARSKDYHASAVPEIEPPCADCLATQRTTDGEKLWCTQHDRKRQHPRGHVHYELPQPFAVGSSIIRPEG